MANIKSEKKRARQTVKKHQKNIARKSSLKTHSIFFIYSLIGKGIPYSWYMNSQDSISGVSVSRINPSKSKTIPLIFINKILADKLTDSEQIIYIY